MDIEKLHNKKLDLFGDVYTIKIADTCTAPDECTVALGITDSINRIITVARTADGNKLSEDQMRITLFHELMHACLNAGAYNQETLDEPMIEWLGKCINKCFMQGLFK